MDVDEPIPSGKALNRSLTTADLLLAERMVKATREAVGVEIDLCIDAHGAFDVPSAVKLGRKLADYDLMWIENPVPMQNMSALAKVSREIATQTPQPVGRDRGNFRCNFSVYKIDQIKLHLP